MKIFLPVSCILFIFLIVDLPSIAQTNNASIRVTNAANETTTFSLADINALPQTTLNIKGEDGAPHTYSGVDVSVLLKKAGISFGKEARKQTLNSYIFIKASDNYSVLYALTEVDSSFSDKKMILANLKDGQTLPFQVGPFQIITTGEKVHARLIRMVTDITVKNVAHTTIKEHN